MGDGAIKVRIPAPEYEGRMWMKPKKWLERTRVESASCITTLSRKEMEYPSSMYHETTHTCVCISIVLNLFFVEVQVETDFASETNWLKSS